MTTEHLFVYGTLRHDAGHIMHGMLAAFSDYVGVAAVRGRLFRVATYPGIVLAGDGMPVVGEVYRLTDRDTILALLDEYEGFGSQCPQPNEFVRIEGDVETEAGETLRAFIYIYNKPVDGLSLIASGDFLHP